MRLGEQLVRDGLVTEDDLETALSHQILHGGRLGSNLIELHLLSMENLGKALGKQRAIPAALEQHFDRVDQSLVDKLSPELAARWSVLPLGWTGNRRNKVAIASTDPLVEEAVFELQAIFDAPIVTAIAPELRLLYWLERAYDIPRASRFKRVGRQRTEADLERADTSPEVRGFVRTITENDVQPVRPNNLGRIAVRRVAMPLSGEVDLPMDPQDLDDCLRSLRQSTSRNKIGKLTTVSLRRAFPPLFDAAILLEIRAETGIGWRGFVAGNDGFQLDTLAIPLAEDSMLREPYANAQGFVGDPSMARDLDRQIWRFLGTPEPVEVAVLPVVIMKEVSYLLYVQANGHLDENEREKLSKVGKSISTAFTKLIRAALR